VETPCGMTLDDEPEPAGTLRSGVGEGLRRLLASAPPLVFVQGHLWIVANSATLSSPNSRKMGDSPAQSGFGGRG